MGNPNPRPNFNQVSAELLQLERHAHLLAPGSAARAALQEKGRALIGLPAETKVRVGVRVRVKVS